MFFDVENVTTGCRVGQTNRIEKTQGSTSDGKQNMQSRIVASCKNITKSSGGMCVCDIDTFCFGW